MKQQSFEFLLIDGFSNLVLASALEPLRDVKLRAVFASPVWSISTIDGESVFSSSNLQISPDQRFEPAKPKDTLVIVAGYKVRDQLTKKLFSTIRSGVRSAKQIIALDTAAWLLADAGVLDGHQATIHWQELDAFQETFPNIAISSERFVRSGKFVTCGGASTTLELILEMIEEIFGPAEAFNASNMFLFDPSRQNELTHGARQFRNRGSPKLIDALDVIAENIETPLTTFELAARVSLSERTLNRVFSKEIGMTTGKYYKLCRLQYARYLVQETRLSIEQISLRCGFSCSSSLRRSFFREFRKPIGACRD